MKGHALRSPVLMALFLVALISVLLLGGGCLDSADNLRRRVEAEVVARRPHPEFVPTPLPYDDTAAVTRPTPAREAALRPIATAMPDVA
ncbi:MAG: hypothetical protein QG637_1620, partial [Chloroflexota bacterium]|nr:hypothetical protein [Chloroflexota bacterium]